MHDDTEGAVYHRERNIQDRMRGGRMRIKGVSRRDGGKWIHPRETAHDKSQAEKCNELTIVAALPRGTQWGDAKIPDVHYRIIQERRDVATDNRSCSD